MSKWNGIDRKKNTLEMRMRFNMKYTDDCFFSFELGMVDFTNRKGKWHIIKPNSQSSYCGWNFLEEFADPDDPLRISRDDKRICKDCHKQWVKNKHD